MEEIWKSIGGFEGIYQISNCGNVRSVKRSKNLKHNNSHGYFTVDLYLNGIRKKIRVHRLVAEAFIPNPDNKPEVNHEDGVKTNNNASNLTWMTHSENGLHAYRTGLNYTVTNTYWKGKIGTEHSKSKPVIQTNEAGNVLNRFAGAREAERQTGVSYQHISSCCTGKQKTAGGYVWKFDNQ